MSGADTRTALLPAAEPVVRDAISALLDTLNVAAAFGSLASGADTLFAEAFLARFVPLHLHFPCELDEFKVASVLPSGAAWADRFDRIVSHCSSVSLLPPQDDPEAGFALCARAAMDAARAAAAALNAQALQLACWDGKATNLRAGTAADVASWSDAGLQTVLVSPH
jgi:hypothetical protein